MAAVYTPTLRGRVLALELRRIRERTGLSQAEAARRMSWDKNKMSRIEQPSTQPTDDDVRALLQMYGLDANRLEALLHLNQDAWQRGWWTAYGDAFCGQFIMLEDQAPEIFGFENALVPGLFQTADYARAIIAGLLNVTGSDLDRRVAARLARQAVLERSSPPRIHYLIDEAVLDRDIGDPDIMRKQVHALREAADRSTVTLQIVPLSARVHAGFEGPFTIFGFPQDRGLDVGHSEGILGEWYAESADQLAKLRLAFSNVSGAAMTPDETLEFLAARAPA
ncbi:helix-turn-helix domain-containing protein [Thermomonospora umbrina]|uniref:Helix-turn-helix protein n=1 Tax=Thermomonospora umbrina TaxID=111806 RepID=A0A3D9T965_9ACTN|nr:helix-turn-helix transcriptional regulator [Thermomonospora umbrina]REF00302.1 helix-turn-helix protein [Thermomonospora umbrina]